MTTFALIHGAWGSGWHWAGLPDELRALGHEAVTPTLPCDDPEATYDDYAQVVVDALRDAGEDVVVVGYSLAGATAPLVAARRPVCELVFVAALVPEPGLPLATVLQRDRFVLTEFAAGVAFEDGSSRWRDFGVYHAVAGLDMPDAVARERFDRSRPQSHRPDAVPCSLEAMPDVPVRAVLCAEDRIIDNAAWRERVAPRLGVDPLELPGGHSPMVTRAPELAALLTA